MTSLCEKCRHYDWRHMQDIIDAFRGAGLDRPKCIWCSASDQPEDIRFKVCENFTERRRR